MVLRSSTAWWMVTPRQNEDGAYETPKERKQWQITIDRICRVCSYERAGIVIGHVMLAWKGPRGEILGASP